MGLAPKCSGSPLQPDKNVICASALCAGHLEIIAALCLLKATAPMASRGLTGLLALGASCACAWSLSGQAATSSPLDATAAVPSLTYASPFDGYRVFQEVESRTWREVNDIVRQAGGHAGSMSSPMHAPQVSPSNGGGRMSPKAEPPVIAKPLAPTSKP